jgi:PIN domain nuclease of toxin-antitoxin system
MNYIIDTHIFLWLIFDPKKISVEKLKQLENCNNTLFISSISFWEISLVFISWKNNPSIKIHLTELLSGFVFAMIIF